MAEPTVEEKKARKKRKAGEAVEGSRDRKRKKE
jgi:hypothetical protein